MSTSANTNHYFCWSCLSQAEYVQEPYNCTTCNSAFVCILGPSDLVHETPIRPVRPQVQVLRPTLYVTPDGRIVQHSDNQRNKLSKREFDRICETLKSQDLNQNQKDESCAICLCEFENNKGTELPNCKHLFHEECIKRWIERKSTCPLCTKIIN